MTGRFVGTVLALLVIIATLMYNSHVSWQVYMQGLKNQQTQLNDKVLEACETTDAQVAGDL